MAMMKTPELNDINLNGFWQKCPQSWHRYILIARFDRPIGWWLLILPGWWIITAFGQTFSQIIFLMGVFLIGGMVMRGAGCIINDMWDRNIDKKIARTAQRPLADGTMTFLQAATFLLFLGALGGIALLQLPVLAWGVGLASLPLIILYPLAKRVTYFPQFVLGLTFSWAVPTAYAALYPTLGEPPLLSSIMLIYAGSVAWVFGYDTIYAIQDLKDDGITGVKSSALGLGRFVQYGVAISYTLALSCWGFGFWLAFGYGVWMVGVMLAALHFLWQITQIDRENPIGARALFISNRDAGLLLTAGFLMQHLLG